MTKYLLFSLLFFYSYFSLAQDTILYIPTHGFFIPPKTIEDDEQQINLLNDSSLVQFMSVDFSKAYFSIDSLSMKKEQCTLSFKGCDKREVISDFNLTFYINYYESNDVHEAFNTTIIYFDKKYPNSELIPILNCHD